MAAPVQPMGQTAIIPAERIRIGSSLRDHLENETAPEVLGRAAIDMEGTYLVSSAATYFAFRYNPTHVDADFPHPDRNLMFGRVMQVLETVLGMNRQQLLDNVNLGQDLIDNADAVEAEFYRRFGDPGEETELEGDGVWQMPPEGRKTRGRGHKLFN